MAERKVAKNPGGPSKRQKTKTTTTTQQEPRLLGSSLWLEDGTTLLPGLCFKDRDELKKAVDWRSIRGEHMCAARETGNGKKDEFTFECIRWKCNWSIRAVKMAKHGLFEITSCTGPDVCEQRGKKTCPDYFDEEFLAYEIDRVVGEHPTLSVAELHKWWNEKFGSEQTFLTHLDEEGEEVNDARGNLQNAKQEAMERLFGDWYQSFGFVPKLMSALQSSNGMLVDWQYDSLPNPASFGSVFWAFSQSVQGFQHCRPVVVVGSKELKGKYDMKLMIASGFDAANNFFPLAFAVTKEVSTDSWRWFLTRIREKVTQRKGLCLITRHHPDILAVVNEPGSQWKEPWAYHRFCLNHLSSQYSRLFPDHQHLFTESLVMKAGSSTQKGEFDSYMKEIKEKSPEGWKWLGQIPPHQWALAHDSGLRYGVMKIDTKALFAVCKSFQKVAMTGGVMLLFSEMKDAFGSSLSSSRGSLHRGDLYAENVMKNFQESLKDSAAYVVKTLDRDAYQVSASSEKKERMSMARLHSFGKYKEYKDGVVQLNDSTCTCGELQGKRFPCLHALAVCKKMKINPLQYADDCYSAERYYKTYEATFSPVPKLSTWPEAFGVPTLFPPVTSPPPLKVSGKGKGKSKEPPSDEELRNAILDILKAMHFKMASFTDIIKQLADKFRYDLTPRKSSIEVMIQYELEKYAADSEEVEGDDEEEDEEEEEEEGLW
ncbi:uncharacterized protein LOC108824572 [Raphanus sativus]|uniref:Uncharacterized protein LOC108824572 n=1 Tax=Raphanus sativus TaxID=3726 RepID=A0A6J0L239_RAPSA|nr:uncharacterized protein LOC108824572 [Raphanus sativus]XP_018453499.1 uncharacterized protein LOC108824572 [Raphanus sativus]